MARIGKCMTKTKLLHARQIEISPQIFKAFTLSPSFIAGLIEFVLLLVICAILSFQLFRYINMDFSEAKTWLFTHCLAHSVKCLSESCIKNITPPSSCLDVSSMIYDGFLHFRHPIVAREREGEAVLPMPRPPTCCCSAVAKPAKSAVEAPRECTRELQEYISTKIQCFNSIAPVNVFMQHLRYHENMAILCPKGQTSYLSILVHHHII